MVHALQDRRHFLRVPFLLHLLFATFLEHENVDFLSEQPPDEVAEVEAMEVVEAELGSQVK